MKRSILVALVACHGSPPEGMPPAPHPAIAVDAAVAAKGELACPPGTHSATGTWAYDEGKTIAPIAWCELADHTKQGPWISRYADGKVAESAGYDRGALDGEWKHFYPTGELAEYGSYVHGAKQGTWRKYWGGGALESEDVLDHDKLVSSSSYFPNGKLEMKGAFAAGAMDGEWNWFHDDGSPAKTVAYTHGRAVEAWRYRNGRKESVPVDEVDLQP